MSLANANYSFRNISSVRAFTLPSVVSGLPKNICFILCMAFRSWAIGFSSSGA